MGGLVPDYGSPLVPRRRLAAELRRLREETGLTGDKVGKRLKWSASKVSRYELARTGLKPEDVAKLLDLYGVRGSDQDELLELAEESTKKGWWEAYSDDLPEELTELIGMEDEATAVWTWQLECIPGLLQSEDYAREVNRGFQEITAMPPAKMERRVAARRLRQQVLTRKAPLRFSAVIDESALLRRVADPAVMRGQLAELADRSRLPNVTVQILPLHVSQPVVTPSFFVLEFGSADTAAPATLPAVAYAEHLVSNLYFGDELDTYRYRQVFERLAAAALTTQESRELINDISQRVWS
jgi:transcriptional regulator with XRE-family HTH domain